MKNIPLIKFLLVVSLIFLTAIAPHAAVKKTTTRSLTLEQLWKKLQQQNGQEQPQSYARTLHNFQERALHERRTDYAILAFLAEWDNAPLLSQDSAARLEARWEEIIAEESDPIQQSVWKHFYGHLLLRNYMSTTHSLTRFSQYQKAVAHLLAPFAFAVQLSTPQTERYKALFQNQRYSSEVFDNDVLSKLTLSLWNSHFWEISEDENSGITPNVASLQMQELLRNNIALYQAQNRLAAALMNELLLARLSNPSSTSLKSVAQRYAQLPWNAYTYALCLEVWYNEMLFNTKQNKGKTRISPFVDSHRVLLRNEQIDSLMAFAQEGLQHYGNTPHAKTLHNFVQEHEAAQCHLALYPNEKESFYQESYRLSSQLYPHQQTVFPFQVVNVSQVALRFWHLAGWTAKDQRFDQLQHRLDTARNQNKILQQLLLSRSYPLAAKATWQAPPTPKHHWLQDSLQLQTPASGIYVIEIAAKGLPTQYRLQIVNSLELLHFQSNQTSLNDSLWIDGLSGKTWTQLPAEQRKDTIYHWSLRNQKDNLFPATTDETQEQTTTLLFPARQLYRPGETFELSGVNFWSKGDAQRTLSQHKGWLFLHDTDFQKIDSALVESDDFGTFSAKFPLPDYLRPGHFWCTYEGLQGTYASTEIQVENYQSPNFQVQISPLGYNKTQDTLRYLCRVNTFSQWPVEQATIRYAYLENDKAYFVSDFATLPHTGKSNARGEFEIAVPVSATLQKNLYRLSVYAQATASNGETQSAVYHHENLGKSPTPTRTPPTIATLQNSPDSLNFVVRGKGTIHYRLLTATQRVEQNSYTVTDSLVLPFVWQENYGDGARVLLVFYENGRISQSGADVVRPYPKKDLQISWHTFRPNSNPGNNETWVLRVDDEHQSPVEANIMARLYESSLRQLGEQPWHFTPHFERKLPFHYLGNSRYWMENITLRQPQQTDPDNEFSLIWPICQPTYGYNNTRYNFFSETSDFAHEQAVDAHWAAPRMAVAQKVLNKEVSPVPSKAIRRNFNAQAFFFPHLRTQQGKAQLRFTLPDALTTWHFEALAHDTAMRFAFLRDSVLSRKTLSVTCKVPAFLREGDAIQLPITLRNLHSKDKGTLHILALDKDRQSIIREEKLKFALSPNESQATTFYLSIPVGVKNLQLRCTAQGKKNSDGEEHIIPILARTQGQSQTVSYSILPSENEPQKDSLARLQLLAQLRTDTKAKFSITAGTNAQEELQQILPQLFRPLGESAYDWASSLYSIHLARLLSDSLISPYEANLRLAMATDKLSDLQAPNGSWSWFKGLPSSRQMTLSIAMLLARSQYFRKVAEGGRLDYDSLKSTTEGAMLFRAIDYLTQELQSESERYERDPSQDFDRRFLLRFTYLMHLLAPADADFQGVIEGIAHTNLQLSLEEKALFAQIASHDQKKKQGPRYLQSLLEHTVAHPEMGRYFDQSIPSFEKSQRIPLQVLALEALQTAPSGRASAMTLYETPEKLRAQMLLWLLQSKRTQMWNNSVAITDALFALMNNRKTNVGDVQWKSLTASYDIAEDSITETGNGFSLQRRLEQWVDGQWIDAIATQQIGDKLRWVYTLRAERDFDHVKLSSTRPACVVPTDIFSGSTWLNSTQAYRAVLSTHNDFYFDHLPKGTYHFTDEMRVSASGTFSCAPATVQSCFAPEFSAIAPSRYFQTK